MRKLIISLLCLGPLTLNADDRGVEILRRMAAAFGGYDSYRVEFTATMQDEFTDTPGVLLVNKEKYNLKMYDSEVFFDGKDGYTYSAAGREVIIETPDPNDSRLFANPARIFQLYERDFEPTYKGAVRIDGKTTSQIDLTPRSPDAIYSKIIVYTDASNHPVRLVYRLKDYGNDLILNVLKITPNIKAGPENFRFDPKKHPGVEIIDFR
jgi:outer membrane lipoprotein-sorting protein